MYANTVSSPFTAPRSFFTALLLSFFFGKIGDLVPEFYSKDQVRPSTFKSANLIPQLLFLGQTHPCANVARKG
jgi:hypothetical protein